MVLRSGSHATTNGLENEREQIAANEDICIHLWLEPRILASNGDNNTTNAEVNTGGEEGRSDGERD